eukprot:gene16564-biopygen9796
MPQGRGAGTVWGDATSQFGLEWRGHGAGRSCAPQVKKQPSITTFFSQLPRPASAAPPAKRQRKGANKRAGAAAAAAAAHVGAVSGCAAQAPKRRRKAAPAAR